MPVYDWWARTRRRPQGRMDVQKTRSSLHLMRHGPPTIGAHAAVAAGKLRGAGLDFSAVGDTACDHSVKLRTTFRDNMRLHVLLRLESRVALSCLLHVWALLPCVSAVRLLRSSSTDGHRPPCRATSPRITTARCLLTTHPLVLLTEAAISPARPKDGQCRVRRDPDHVRRSSPRRQPIIARYKANADLILESFPSRPMGPAAPPRTPLACLTTPVRLLPVTCAGFS